MSNLSTSTTINFTEWISSDFDSPYFERLVGFCERYHQATNNVFPGRNRIVFGFDSHVIKVPCSINGCQDNDWEGSVSNTPESFMDYNFIQYPETKLWYEKDIPLLRMEIVEHAGYDDINSRLGFIPDWVGCIDCGQVGFTKAGRLVAYDYGCY